MVIDFLHKKYLTVAVFVLLAIFGLTGNTFGFQTGTVDLEQLKRAFVAEFKENFELVKTELRNHADGSEKHQYWLAHVKPKRTGVFTLKYSYKFADKFYAEGETEMKLAVGGTNGSRYPQTVREISYFCLGDTIIIPIRLDKFSKHVFSLRSEYKKPEEIEESRFSYDYYESQLNTEKAANPLEKNLKYLGTYREDHLIRSGGGTFTYLAVFKANSAGQFNLDLFFEYDFENKKINRSRTTPIIIVDRGTPITSVVPQERATYFIKDRTYDSGEINSFGTNLLILLPGDVIAVPFLFYTEQPFWKEKDKRQEVSARPQNPIPIIRQQPFLLERKDFNEWIIDYLPN